MNKGKLILMLALVFLFFSSNAQIKRLDTLAQLGKSGYRVYTSNKSNEKNKVITIPPLSEGSGEAIVFHAGTKQDEAGNIVTNGGRVLAVTSQGNTLTAAVNQSKKILEQISFEGMYYRRDIGYEFSKLI